MPNKIKLYISSAEYLKKHNPNVVKILNMKDFINTCSSVPLFSNFKSNSYYYTDLDISKEDFDVLLKTSHNFIFVVNEVDKRNFIYKYCEKNDCIFEEPKINSVSIKKKYPKISSESVNKIIKFIKDNNRLDNITNILNAFNSVDDDKINWVFLGDFENEIFQCIDYLLIGNSKKFYKLYTDLIDSGESKYKMLVILYGKLKTLLQIKPYLKLNVTEITKKTGLNYYQVKNNLLLAAKYSEKLLTSWFMECGSIERDIKYGTSSEDIDFEYLLIKILRGVK